MMDDLLDAEEIVTLLRVSVDDYARALQSICRCEHVCECTDDQILAALKRLREHDDHAARIRGPARRKQNRRTK